MVLIKLIFHYYEILMGKKRSQPNTSHSKSKYHSSIYILQMSFLVFAPEMFVCISLRNITLAFYVLFIAVFVFHVLILCSSTQNTMPSFAENKFRIQHRHHRKMDANTSQIGSTEISLPLKLKLQKCPKSTFV